MTTLLPTIINAIQDAIVENLDEVTELDCAIGDGDHVVNLQRGLAALAKISGELAAMDWAAAFMKMGMTLMAIMGGASGLLLGSMLVSMAKASQGKELDVASFSAIFNQGVEAIKRRGKSDIGEKTMLDTLIPVANSLQADAANNTDFKQLLEHVVQQAIKGMESTKEMVATKGRASFLGERAIGHIDAGARTSQLMIGAVVDVLQQR